MLTLKDLPLDENLTGKWLEMLDWPETRGRAMVQNYYTGRVKLVKPSNIPMMTGPIRHEDKGVKVNAAPIWRQVREPEAAELWRVEVYLEFYMHQAVWAQHDFDRCDGAVEAMGGENKNVDLITDSRRRERAAKANRAAANRDKAAVRARAYMEKGGVQVAEVSRSGATHLSIREGVLAKFLRDVAATHRVQRDIDQTADKEAEVFKREEMRERARRTVIDELDSGSSPKPKRKKSKEEEPTYDQVESSGE